MRDGRDRLRQFLLEQMPANGVCAEIGVWRGDFSELILRHSAPSELHLIDPWAFVPDYPRRLYGGLSAKSQQDMDRIYQSVVQRFSAVPEVRVHRTSSVEAARMFPKEFFDWVYVDGDHSYDAVLSDLRHWAGTIKPGGYLTGDDVNWVDEQKAQPVKAAVLDFLRDRDAREFQIKNGQFVLKL